MSKSTRSKGPKEVGSTYNSVKKVKKWAKNVKSAKDVKISKKIKGATMSNAI